MAPVDEEVKSHMSLAPQSSHQLQATLGFASLALLWLAVVGGFLLRNRAARSRSEPLRFNSIHQTVALLGLCLGAMHGVSQLLVPDGLVTAPDLVVPFINEADPIGIGVAVVAIDVMAAIAVSVVIQRRLGVAGWRTLHSLSYAAFTLLAAHVLISGSDVAHAWVWVPVTLGWLVTIGLWMTMFKLDGVGRWFLARLPATGRRAPAIEIRVAADRCLLSGMCGRTAPDSFRLGPDGLSHRAHVGLEQAELVAGAIEACPVRAISFGELWVGSPADRGDVGSAAGVSAYGNPAW